MAPFASAIRHHRLALALSSIAALFIAFAGVTALTASERVPLTPDLSGVLTYVVEDGSYVAVEAGYPDTLIDVPVDVAGAAGDEVPSAYVSPDGRYTAAIRRDDDGAHIDVTTGTREVASYWIASPSDAEVVVDGKGPARAVEGVPLTIAWSPDSRRLAFGSISGTPWALQVVSASTWLQSGFEVQGGYVGELAWSPDSSQLAISTYEIDRSDHNVLMFDVATRTVRDLIDGCSIVWAPNGAFLAVHREPSVETGVWMTSSDGLARFEATDDPMAFPVSWIELTS